MPSTDLLLGGFGGNRASQYTSYQTRFRQEMSSVWETGRTGRAIRGKNTVVTIRGLDAVAIDKAALAAALADLSYHMLNHTGALLVKQAQAFAPVSNFESNYHPVFNPWGLPTYYEGALRDSINHYMWTEGQWRLGFNAGPSVFYAPFVHWGTATQQPNPFMSRANDVIEPQFRAGAREVGRVFSGLRKLSPPYSQATAGVFGQYRKYLYSAEKALGDIQPFGLTSLLSGPRGQLLRGARLLGDLDSVMTNTIGMRVTRRLEGRISGKLIGFGRVPFQGGGSYSSFIGGRVGARIYQRQAAKIVARYIKPRLP